MSDEVKAWMRFVACVMLCVAERRPFVIIRKVNPWTDPLPAWLNVARLPW